MKRYQVAYEGQIITEPLDFATAAAIAAAENMDAFYDAGPSVAIAEVVLAPELEVIK